MNTQQENAKIHPLILAGPTCVGKSELAIEVCEQINGEIISMDSMQLYCGMDIGTAKPSKTQRTQLPHHMLDVAEPDQPIAVADYQCMALEAAENITAKGKSPVFAGGTFLYLKALLYGLFDGPPKDEALRETLQKQAKEKGPECLHQRLETVDPLSAERLHPADIRRVIRALEVHHLTGSPLSSLQKQWTKQEKDRLPCCLIFLTRPKDTLEARINARVNRMFEHGLVEEVRGLKDCLSKEAAQAVGYREILEYFQKQHDLETARSLIKVHTRQFAKHQRTWMRQITPDAVLDLSTQTHPGEVIVEQYQVALSSLTE